MNRVVVALLCAALAAACRDSDDEDESGASELHRIDALGRVVLSSRERRALDLRTEPSKRGTLALRALRFGQASARPQEQTVVIAPVTSRLLTAPSVTLGESVNAGATLVVLEVLADPAARAGLAIQRRELQGQVAGARARVRSLQADVERLDALTASRLATAADVVRGQAELQAEQARLSSLEQAGTELAQLTGGSLALRAPAAGVVAALASEVGAEIEQGAIVARLIRDGPRWVDVGAAPDDPVGGAYRVHVSEGWADARLLSRGAIVQPDGTRRDRIEVALPAAAEILPGATLSIEVVREVEGVIVPEDAVVLAASEPMVFVEVQPGHFAAREVTLGPREAGLVVLAGLEANAQVVVRGAAALLGERGYGGATVRDGGWP